MNWANPSWFNGFWLVLLLILFFFWREQRRKRELERFVSAPLWRQMVNVDRFRQWLKWGCIFTTILFLVLALARPQKKGDLVKVERKGIDLIVALDTSSSMRAQDFKPNRFAKAKREISSLISNLKGDRIGIVVFSGVSFLQCPLTLDYRAAKLFTEAMEVDMLPLPGTAIGEAIRTAIRAFDNKGPQKKVIILITDGEDHDSRPMEAVEQAHAMGIKIFCIGIGKPDGEPIPIVDARGRVSGYKKDESGNVILSRLGEQTLQEIALKTGGSYYRATTGELELERIYKEIEGLEKGKFEEDYVTQYEDRFFYLLWIAFLLLCVEMMIGERKVKDRRSKGEGSCRRRRPMFSNFISNSFHLPPSTFHLILLSCLLIAWKPPVEHRNGKGNELYKKQNYEEALKVYQDAQSDAPQKPELNYNIGNALYQQKKYDMAKESYQQSVLASDPKLRANAYYNLGSVQFRKGDLRDSLRLFEKALELNPKDEDTRYNIELIKKLLEKQPPPPEEQKAEEQQEQQQQDQKQDKGGGVEQKDEGPFDPAQGRRETKDEKEQEQKQGQEQDKQKQEAEGRKKEEETKGQKPKTEDEQQQGEEQQRQAQGGQSVKQEQDEEQETEGSMSRQEADRILDALEEKPDEVGKLFRNYYPKSKEELPVKDW